MTQEKARRGRKAGDNAAASSVQVLDRSLKLLSLIASHDNTSLTRLAELSEMAPSTVHRLLTSLANHGMVAHDGETGDWTIGVKAFEIGNAFRRFQKLGVTARPFLKQLMEASGETANIGLIDENDVVFIAQAESHAAMRAFFRPGRRSPVHASGIGKAILASWTDSQIMQAIGDTALPGFTHHTLTSVPALLDDLHRVRARGFAIDNEEHTLGMCCIAAPIFNEFGEAVAGISISGPSARLPQDRLESLGPLVQQMAGTLTRAIGGIPSPLQSAS